MSLLAEIWLLLLKDLRLEWRQRTALGGLLLYVGGTVYVSYLSFSFRGGAPPAPAWNALFWVILLFAALGAAGRGLAQESAGLRLYYYTVARPEAVILAKIAYNFLLLLALALPALLLYSLLLGNPVQDEPLYVASIALGALSLATSLTLVAGIAARAGQAGGGTLLAVLGLPVLVPVLLLLIKVSKNALDGLARDASQGPIVALLALNLIVVAVSYLLFPFLWRS
ncbi:heme exporter protein CcmB [Hymenobacter polaris]|uniref:heme exporter protein CcmB n=1 Tax=Hymenobacter polaris TaxID=2682546 RepID=UPI00293BF477|nr:heme exporter protein CcmB [Hymenobacter polaris]